MGNNYSSLVVILFMIKMNYTEMKNIFVEYLNHEVMTMIKYIVDIVSNVDIEFMLLIKLYDKIGKI